MSPPAAPLVALDTSAAVPLLVQTHAAHADVARGVAGGAVYDGVVALAAVRADAPLGTRDARARATYEAVGATVLAVA